MEIRFECCQHCIGHRNDPNKYNNHLAPCTQGCNGAIVARASDKDDRANGTS